MTALNIEVTKQQAQPLRPNEASALLELEAAIAENGPKSPAADGARRHLRIIRHFNARYAFV